MYPTIHHRDIVFVRNLKALSSDQIKRQNIVLFDRFGNEYLKRIIGVPGDTVQVTAEGRIILNGVPLDEPYALIITPHSDVEISIQIPPGNLFVLGDYRDVSVDSRSWGVLPIELVRGVMIGRVHTGN